MFVDLTKRREIKGRSISCNPANVDPSGQFPPAVPGYHRRGLGVSAFGIAVMTNLVYTFYASCIRICSRSDRCNIWSLRHNSSFDLGCFRSVVNGLSAIHWRANTDGRLIMG